MANTYRWFINEMDVVPNIDTLNKVVKRIKWKYIADDGIGHEVYLFGQTTIPDPDPNNYTVYENLTETKVIEWLEQYTSVDELNSKLDGMINEKVNPPIINPGLPW